LSSKKNSRSPFCPLNASIRYKQTKAVTKLIDFIFFKKALRSIPVSNPHVMTVDKNLVYLIAIKGSIELKELDQEQIWRFLTIFKSFFMRTSVMQRDNCIIDIINWVSNDKEPSKCSKHKGVGELNKIV